MPEPALLNGATKDIVTILLGGVGGLVTGIGVLYYQYTNFLKSTMDDYKGWTERVTAALERNSIEREDDRKLKDLMMEEIKSCKQMREFFKDVQK